MPPSSRPRPAIALRRRCTVRARQACRARPVACDARHQTVTRSGSTTQALDDADARARTHSAWRGNYGDEGKRGDGVVRRRHRETWPLRRRRSRSDMSYWRCCAKVRLTLGCVGRAAAYDRAHVVTAALSRQHCARDEL